MLRSLSLAVLAFLILSAAVPALAAEPACPDGALSAIFDTPGETGGEALFSPQYDPQNKVCIYTCDWWGSVTSIHWGMGSDCNASNNNLASLVGSEAISTGPGLCDTAGAALGYCGFILVITGACHWDVEHAMYVTDGYGKIKCKDYC